MQAYSSCSPVQKKKKEKMTEICEEPVTERNDDKDEEFIQLTKMVNNKTKSDFALTKKNVSSYL